MRDTDSQSALQGPAVESERTLVVRRITTLVAVVLVATPALGAPAWADHTTAHTIEQMTAHYQDPGLEAQNKPFALLYLRTTEGMRDANNAGEFSDPGSGTPGSSRPSPPTTWTPTLPGSAATPGRSTRPGGSPSGPTPSG